VAGYLMKTSDAAGNRAADSFRKMSFRQLAQGDVEWDEDSGHVVQSLDAVLDEALEAFQSGETQQGIDLVVAANVTVDEVLSIMGLQDSDEPGGEASASASASVEDDEDEKGIDDGSGHSASPSHVVGRAGVDNGSWDGPGAMSACTNSSTPASCFGSICAGRKSGPPENASSWALPHHSRPGAAPNAKGVSAALAALHGARGGVMGLTNRAAAEKHLQAHQNAIEKSSKANSARELALGARRNGAPPRDGLVRGVFLTDFRAGQWSEDETPQDPPTLFGHFALFNEWTEIDSFWEGNFMESLAPGCFDKTIAENRDNIRCLFQHGRDPVIGSKVLGPIEQLNTDEHGVYYEVPLYDTTYNRDLLPALSDNQYGASFRFRVLREEVAEEPGASDWNPKGIPERKVTELELMEFGPVTFPQYAGATAGMRGHRMRSLTDDVILLTLGFSRDRMEEFVAHYLQQHTGTAPEPRAEETHPEARAASRPARALEVVRNPHRGH